MGYTTQMDAARQGIVTKEMEAVAAYEKMDAEALRELVAKGQVCIPANKHHTCLKPYGIGKALKTKINVNLGTSRDCMDMNVEMEKVMQAVNMGAEAIMDLSSFGDTQVFRRKLTAQDGTVKSDGSRRLSPDELLRMDWLCQNIIGSIPTFDEILPMSQSIVRELGVYRDQIPAIKETSL